MDLEPGATAEVATTVGPDRTAHAMGNHGVHVLATPFLIGLLEDAAGAILRPRLPTGAGTVGTMVEMKHLAATPVGMKVRAKRPRPRPAANPSFFPSEPGAGRDRTPRGAPDRSAARTPRKFPSPARAKPR